MNINTADVFNPRPKVVKAFPLKFNVKAKIGTYQKKKSSQKPHALVTTSIAFQIICHGLTWL